MIEDMEGKGHVKSSMPVIWWPTILRHIRTLIPTNICTEKGMGETRVHNHTHIPV
jgi:hypothetical protein